MAELEAGRELDALVAERVMGWRLEPQGIDPLDPQKKRVLTRRWLDREGDSTGWDEGDLYDYDRTAFSPSTDIAAAWLVVEKLGLIVMPWEDEGWLALLPEDSAYISADGRGGATLDFHVSDTACFAPTAPLAICRAALAAVATNTQKAL